MNHWDYSTLTEPAPYGDTTTYEIGADWLADCSLIEDWGCGKGWLRTLIEPGRYRGIDGSPSLYADEVVDLSVYRSSVPGVFIRHVLEHNFNWRQILGNALASAQDKLCLIVFTPLSEVTHVIASEMVPDISFSLADLTDCMEGFTWNIDTFETNTQYGVESVIRCQR